MDKTELKELLKEFKEGKANVFDRKNTSITFRCSIPLKVWIHQQAAEKGFDSVSTYIEHCLVATEQHEEKKVENTSLKDLKNVDELIGTYKKSLAELENLKTKQEKIKELYEIARNFTDSRPDDFYEFLNHLEPLL